MNHNERLQAAASKAWEKLQAAHPDALAQWPDSRKAELMQALGFSDFICASMVRDVQLLPWLALHLDDTSRCDDYRDQLAECLSHVRDEAGLMRELRAFSSS